jgi:hypothetical protein
MIRPHQIIAGVGFLPALYGPQLKSYSSIMSAANSRSAFTEAGPAKLLSMGS